MSKKVAMMLRRDNMEFAKEHDIEWYMGFSGVSIHQAKCLATNFAYDLCNEVEVCPHYEDCKIKYEEAN